MDIVLIPGALSTSEFWHHQEHYLQKKMRIHHASDFPGQTIAEMAEKILIDLLEKFTLIGFSLGGYIALELMRQIPHRIQKLVLINTAAKAVCERGQNERKRSLDLINKGKFDFLINLLTSILNKPDQTELLTTIQCPTLLITSNEDHVMPPERSEHMAGHIKNPQLVYIEKCGHMAPLEQPDTINQILHDWL